MGFAASSDLGVQEIMPAAATAAKMAFLSLIASEVSNNPGYGQIGGPGQDGERLREPGRNSAALQNKSAAPKWSGALNCAFKEA